VRDPAVPREIVPLAPEGSVENLQPLAGAHAVRRGDAVRGRELLTDTPLQRAIVLSVSPYFTV
jgi:hypothetical protein